MIFRFCPNSREQIVYLCSSFQWFKFQKLQCSVPHSAGPIFMHSRACSRQLSYALRCLSWKLHTYFYRFAQSFFVITSTLPWRYNITCTLPWRYNMPLLINLCILIKSCRYFRYLESFLRLLRTPHFTLLWSPYYYDVPLYFSMTLLPQPTSLSSITLGNSCRSVTSTGSFYYS